VPRGRGTSAVVAARDRGGSGLDRPSSARRSRRRAASVGPRPVDGAMEGAREPRVSPNGRGCHVPPPQGRGDDLARHDVLGRRGRRSRLGDAQAPTCATCRAWFSSRLSPTARRSTRASSRWGSHAALNWESTGRWCDRRWHSCPSKIWPPRLRGPPPGRSSFPGVRKGSCPRRWTPPRTARTLRA
jgi:hypothetical protein